MDGDRPESRSAAGGAPTMVFPWYASWAARDPGFPAVVSPAGVLSYGELWVRVGRQARSLASGGAGPGVDLVLDLAPDIAPDPGQWIVALMGALSAGAGVVLPDTAWSNARRTASLASLDPAAVLEGGQSPRLRFLARRGPKAEPARDPGAGVWLFTSGTTAEPRPYFRSVPQLRRMVDRVRRRTADDVAAARPASLCLVPLDHGYGLVNALLLVHAMGGTVVLADGADPGQAVRHLRDHSATVLFGWPTHFERLADPALWLRSARGALAWCVSSSYRLDPAVGVRFAKVSGCPVRQQYGLTETGPLCLDGERPPSAVPHCVGRPLDGVRVEVLDDDDRPLPPGAEGRLAVALDDGPAGRPGGRGGGLWPTGDTGGRDEEGRVFVVGRARPFTDERGEF